MNEQSDSIIKELRAIRKEMGDLNFTNNEIKVKMLEMNKKMVMRVAQGVVIGSFVTVFLAWFLSIVYG